MITQSTADAVARARARGAPVVAVGTTTARALESAADPARPGHVRAASEETRLLIQPGYAFRVVDALFTNFHLPCSTLLAMVTAFGGGPSAAMDSGPRDRSATIGKRRDFPRAGIGMASCSAGRLSLPRLIEFRRSHSYRTSSSTLHRLGSSQ